MEESVKKKHQKNKQIVYALQVRVSKKMLPTTCYPMPEVKLVCKSESYSEPLLLPVHLQFQAGH